MVKKLMTKSAFARLAGVSAAAVTKAAAGNLAGAFDGRRIDAAHPLAVKYLKRRAEDETRKIDTGLDPIYYDVVAWCDEHNRYSTTGVRKQFGLGYDRARKLTQMMALNGVVPKKVRKKPVAEPKRAPHVRGHAAANETAKQASLAKLAAKVESAPPPPEPGPAPPPPEPEEFFVPEDIAAFLGYTLGDLIVQFGTDVAFGDWLKATKDIEMIQEKRLKNAVTKGELVSRDLIKVGIIEPIDSAHRKLLTDGSKTMALRATAMHDAGRDRGEIEKFIKDQITSFIRPVKARVARALKNV